MSAIRTERRLAAILAADVAGYSRLMAADEAGTLATLKALHREVFAPAVRQHGGRIVKLMGDGALVEFASVVDAVNAAVAIQQANAARIASEPSERRAAMRIGVDLGDVIVEGGDIYGDGVNLAARLQALAAPGGITMSATAHEHSAGKVGAGFSDGSTQSLKNIVAPVRVFHWTDSKAPPPRPAVVPALPDRPSIAVLPFDNMSGDPNQDYFADGFVEAITAALSRIRAFFVIARNSALTYKGRAVSVRDIGRELGVAYLLEGSVQRAGNRVCITVQLVETAGGAHLWAEKYDGSRDDIFDLQGRSTEQVAGALQTSIRLAEFEAACAARAIPLWVLPPKSPEMNGRVERMQATWRHEFYAAYDPPHQVAELNQLLDAHAHRYNTWRPHDALGQISPLQYLCKRDSDNPAAKARASHMS